MTLIAVAGPHGVADVALASRRADFARHPNTFGRDERMADRARPSVFRREVSGA